jgi:hypothetical protein
VIGSSELAPDVARWLASDEGRSQVDRITASLDAGGDELAIAARLRRDGLDASSATAVTGAADARRRARARWVDADELLFTPISLEQASDPEVSAWRATRLAQGVVWDLCAGIGGDTLALAGVGAEVTAVDLDEARLILLAHNARIRGLDVEIRHDDALTAPVPPGAAVHVDPARRRDGRRVRLLAHHLPPVGALVAAYADAPALAIVLSPAVDLGDPDLPADAELEFVQVGDDLREAVVWLGEARRPGARATATLLPSGVSRSRDERGPRVPVGEVGEVLLQPAPAAVRARLHDQLGAEVGARRLSASRALLTVDELPPPSPWYRRRWVHAALPARPKAIRAWLRAAEPRPVEIALHGVDADVGAWWRTLGRPPRGPAGWRIELVRTDHGALALVTSDHPDG